jgi:DNA-binding SARP family transcriptional activator
MVRSARAMIEFGVLGPIEASRAGKAIQLGGGKQRALLAILLLNANEVVSADRLIDQLWGESAPETAGKALQVHVSRLRKALEPRRGPGDPGRVLITKSPGYMLALEPDQLDLTRFDRLAGEGRAALAGGDSRRAAAQLHEALSLWRGPPLADIAFEPFAQAECTRLEELRVAALEDRIAADLDCGRHTEVVGELESLIAVDQLRERPRGQLMLALPVGPSGRGPRGLPCGSRDPGRGAWHRAGQGASAPQRGDPGPGSRAGSRTGARPGARNRVCSGRCSWGRSGGPRRVLRGFRGSRA